MSRVDFYVLASGGAEARWLTACRITEKAWRQGHTVVLRTDDAAQAAQLDRLLWTFRDDSFVPHECWQPGQEAAAPVLITCGDHACGQATVLVNLGEQVPALAQLPPRVAEIVPSDEAGRASGRERFRLYRQQDLELVTHEL